MSKIKKMVYKVLSGLPIENIKMKNTINIEKYFEEYSNPFTDMNSQNIQLNDTSLDISIIVPVYNTVDGLEKCLDSILNQITQYEYEVLVIDNGSSNAECLNILDKYRGKNRININRLEENAGISGARNFGMELAKGEYFCFCDSDDSLSEEFVEKILSIAKERECDYVKCGYKETFSSGNERIYIKDKEYHLQHGDVEIKEFDGYVWGSIYHRKLWTKYKFPMNYWYEDMITRLIIMKQSNNFYYLNEPLYIKYTNDNSTVAKVWNSNNLKCFDHIFLMNFILEVYKNERWKLDQNMLELVLHELGIMAYYRSVTLEKNMQKEFFYVCALVYQKHISNFDFNIRKLGKYERKVHKSLLNNNYYLWKFITNS